MDDRNHMHHRPAWIPWAMTSLALLVVAAIAYAIGARHEVVAASGAPVIYTSHFGFPGFFGILLLFFIFGGLRRMFWWGGYGYCRPWRSRRFYDHRDDERLDWEEWHRREHQRMDDARGRGPSAPSDAAGSGNARRD